MYEPLDLPEFTKYGMDKKEASLMKAVGGLCLFHFSPEDAANWNSTQNQGYLADVVRKNPHSFRIFSPDGMSLDALHFSRCGYGRGLM